jgi:DNA-binding NarL/FixJ family response regulator
MTLRVLLADDHALVRAGFRTLVESTEGFEVIGEVGDGEVALRTIQEHRPDLVLLDIGLPGMNGLEVAERVAREALGTKIVILSMHATEEYVLTALRAGAVGYLLKDASVDELKLALRAVSRGETYLSPAISRHVIEGYIQRVGTDAPLDETLTPRQREVLQLIAEGHSTKEIAHRLGLSGKTVETHRAQLMERLKIYDVAGLVRYAIRIGLITPER